MYKGTLSTMKNLHLIFTSLIVLCTACTHPSNSQPTAAPEVKRPDITLMNSLLGEWHTKPASKNEKKEVVVYRSTSGGSVVEETLFPKTEHEMVSMYYNDQGGLAMTHYCLMHNEPELAAEYLDSNSILFKFAGGKNLDSSKDMHMHEMKLTILGPDHITQEWKGYKNGVADNDHVKVMDLIRVKKGVMPKMASTCGCKSEKAEKSCKG